MGRVMRGLSGGVVNVVRPRTLVLRERQCMSPRGLTRSPATTPPPMMRMAWRPMLLRACG